MKKLVIIAIAIGFVAVSAFAQNGNSCKSDKVFQFNIIGVTKAKTAEMQKETGIGARMFVPLGSQEQVAHTDINMACGDKFQITDANATDGSGMLEVPCNTSAPTDLCFEVSAVGLGTPGGHADVTVVCEYKAGVNYISPSGGTDCVTDLVSFSISRTNDNSNKPKQIDITDAFRASGCFDVDLSGTCTNADINFNNVWIFNLSQLESYYWEYDNYGLKVMQVRFCDVSDVEGACGTYTLPTS